MGVVAVDWEEVAKTGESRDFGEALAQAKEQPRHPVHAFHRWYGKLIPAIPAAAIDAFTEPGELVVEPFCGSGTSLVEAVRADRRSLGVDLNPLAGLLARVKTGALSDDRLSRGLADFAQRRASWNDSDWSSRLPELPNLAHFYPEPVARDLLACFETAHATEDPELRDWLLACCSAINRDVSNADTRHVFPGVSKRMRALIADGWMGDVARRFARASGDRRAWSVALTEETVGHPRPDLRIGSIVDQDLPVGSAALVVTNPPYVSSVRWVETFKLEAYWLGVVADRSELHALDRRMLGTERLDHDGTRPETLVEACPSPSFRRAVADLVEAGHPRRATIVARFAIGLSTAMTRAATSLRPGGHAVVKLAPSRLKSVVIDSPRCCAEILMSAGLELVGALRDDYAPGSRSLTMSRNWYSGRMDQDLLLIARRPSA
ncbi:MAG: hypothetical protein AAF533_07885 [Acidobacteriota bacterium]